jgi:hypothetical protein
MDHLADKGIVKPNPKSRCGRNNRLVSITKPPRDNCSLLFLGSRPGRVRRAFQNVCKLGYFLLSLTINNNFVPGMVKNLLLRPVCLNQISSPLNEHASPGL